MHYHVVFEAFLHLFLTSFITVVDCQVISLEQRHEGSRDQLERGNYYYIDDVKRTRRVQQQEFYDLGCASTNVFDGPESISKMEKNVRKNICMCTFLKDSIEPDVTLRSIRTKTRTVSPQEDGYRNNNVTRSNSLIRSSVQKQTATTRQTGIPCINGYITIKDQQRYPCKDVTLLSFLSIFELSKAYGNLSDRMSDVWGWTDGVNEIAMIGTFSGVAFVDITVPNQPRYMGKLPPSNGGGSNWRSIKVYKNYAYMVSENGTMQFVNMTKLVQFKKIFPLQGIILTPYAQKYVSNSYAITKTHNLYINEETGFAYLVGSNQCSGGLYMVDLRIPSTPVFAGCYSKDGYTHDVQCVIYRGIDLRYRGREICFACNVDTVAIIDVTDKSNPRMISNTTYPGMQYTHQGSLTEDHNYFIIGDEYDERNSNTTMRSIIMNVQNLVSPKIAGFYQSSLTAVDHNQYVKGKYVYQANYRAGLRILEINDLSSAKLTEVAYLDIFPLDDLNDFNGAWSAYPFFPSGSILISGIEQGLYIVKKN